MLDPLTTAINKLFSTGILPDCVEVAQVVPVFKQGDRAKLTTYRPIAILPSILKILERVIHKRLFAYLTSTSKYLLYKCQYGFRKGHSTNQAIIQLVSKIVEEFDDNKFTLELFLDPSKAFDTINHDILSYKLQHYGIGGHALDRLRSYLSARRQYTDFNGESQICPNNSGLWSTTRLYFGTVSVYCLCKRCV